MQGYRHHKKADPLITQFLHDENRDIPIIFQTNVEKIIYYKSKHVINIIKILDFVKVTHHLKRVGWSWTFLLDWLIPFKRVPGKFFNKSLQKSDGYFELLTILLPFIWKFNINLLHKMMSYIFHSIIVSKRQMVSINLVRRFYIFL